MTDIELSRALLPTGQSPLPRHSNPFDVYVGSLGNDESQRAMAGCLNRIAVILARDHAVELPTPPGRYVTWGALRYADTMKVRAALLQAVNADGAPLAPAYVNKHLAALRRVIEHAWNLGQISTDDYMRAIKIDGVKGTRLPAGRNIAGSEVAAMLAVCLEDPSPAGERDAALIAFLQSTGGRRAEASSARREEYDPGTRTLTIIGKRNKQRELDIHEQAAVYLGRWLSRFGRAPGPLFCQIDRWGTLRADRHLSPGAIAKIVNKRRLQAGLPPLGPHDFRRTFIGDLLDEGVDLSTAQQIVGHDSPTTTARYDRRPRRTRKAAVEKVAHRLPSPEEIQRDAGGERPL